MSLTLLVRVIRNTATPAVQGLIDNLTTQRMAAAVGPAGARLTQQHLRGLGTNKRGWPSTHFWARAAKATDWREDPRGALISVNQVGVRQRYRGGPISPVSKEALAVPISPVSYGHLPSDFPGLFRLKTPRGVYLVQYGAEVLEKTKGAKSKAVRGQGGNWKRRRTGGINFLFKLMGGVNQNPNPNVLPSEAEYRLTAQAAILKAVKIGGRTSTYGIVITSPGTPV